MGLQGLVAVFSGPFKLYQKNMCNTMLAFVGIVGVFAQLLAKKK